MASFHLHSFGCRASQADGAALKRQLLDAGLEEAQSAAESDVAVLNTCTVTAKADAEVRQVVRRIHRTNPACRILVTGCYAQRAPAEIAGLEGVAWVVGNSHKHAVAEILAKVRGAEADATGFNDVSVRPAAPGAESGNGGRVGQPLTLPENVGAESGDGKRLGRALLLSENVGVQVLVGEISDEFHFAPAFPDDRTRPTLKVQDGCNARCSFCIIPDVRGSSRSLAPERAIEQVRALDAYGFKEIVLSGINLGSYGRDLAPRFTFLGLLERILAETSIVRLRISSIEPMDVSPDLIRLAAGDSRLADHFHVPLQTGCDRILRAMNRRYWTTQYAERIHAIRAALPHAAIGADVMVGFPGETAADHAASLRFIESLPLTYVHVFPYSRRPGTPAAARPGQVEGGIAHERGREIRAAVEEKRQAFLAAQIGRSLAALTLDDKEDGSPVALTSNYLRVALPGTGVRPNTLLSVGIGRVAGGLLYGYPEP
jgi:threonylcarbamoyladenosine tRNA methylthiotransferase MtaB